MVCGRSGDGLAEDRLSQQQHASEQEEKGDETEGCAGCGHD